MEISNMDIIDGLHLAYEDDPALSRAFAASSLVVCPS